MIFVIGLIEVVSFPVSNSSFMLQPIKLHPLMFPRINHAEMCRRLIPFLGPAACTVVNSRLTRDNERRYFGEIDYWGRDSKTNHIDSNGQDHRQRKAADKASKPN